MGSVICRAGCWNHHRLRNSGDAVCVFSNGGFGNIHAKLLERLKTRR